MEAYRAMNGLSGDKPVVVTGGAGYIGSLLVRQLLDRGNRVRIVDSLLYGDGAISDLLSHPRCELVVSDIRDRVAVTDALAGAEAVIHLGAIVGDAACALDEERTRTTNTMATELIAEQCRLLGVPRLIFASTCSVYGASHAPLDENSDLRPVSLYARSKIEAEQLLLGHQCDGFTPVVLRFGTAYGASRRYRFDLVINLLTARAVREGFITIHGGDQWRPFIHAFDIARAVVLALRAPQEAVTGQIINIGVDAQNYRLGQIGEIIHELVPESVVTTNDKVTDLRNYYVRFGKARDVLDFDPTRTVEDGIREIVEALTRNDVRDYNDVRFHNVDALRSPAAEYQEAQYQNAFALSAERRGNQDFEPAASSASGMG